MNSSPPRARSGIVPPEVPLTHHSALNPFATPHSASVLAPADDLTLTAASPERRLAGQLIDSVAAVVMVAPILVVGVALGLVVSSEAAAPGTPEGNASSAIVLAAFLPYAGLNAFLVSTRGQSIGKIVSGTRIVGVDGTAVGFVRGVVVRSWVFLALQLIPCLGPLLSIADAVSIGAQNHRMLHDKLAGTRVIRVA